MKQFKILLLTSMIILFTACDSGSSLNNKSVGVVGERSARVVTKETKITGLYVAYFNRAADQEGLKYWTDKADEVAKAGGDASSVFKKLSGGFATHPTFKSTYDHLNNKEFVSLIYRNALRRAGDAEGIAYWTKKLDAEGMIRSDMVSDFVELSLETDLTPENYPNLSAEELAAGQLRQDLITNKVTVALAFTHQLGVLSNVVDSQYPENDPAYLGSIAIISEVTEDPETVSATLAFLDSSEGSDDPIRDILEDISVIKIDLLSKTSASPGSFITITGSGFASDSALSVRFFCGESLAMDVPVLDFNATTVVVPVPFFIDTTTEEFGSGIVNVQVIQTFGTTTLASNTISEFEISPMPALTLPAGAVTANMAGFLELTLADLQNRLSELDTFLDGQIDSADLRSSLENARNQFGTLKDKIRNAIANLDQVETIGEINGIPVTLDQENLRFADQWMVAVIDGILADIQSISPAQASVNSPSFSFEGEDPAIIKMQKMWKTKDGSELSSQEFYKEALLESRDTLVDIGKKFMAGTAVIGAAIVTSGGSIPINVVALLTTAGIINTSVIIQMDATMLSIKSDKKETAKKLLDDFNGFLKSTTTGVLSPIIGAISKSAGIAFDLYNGMKPLLEDKFPDYLNQALAFFEEIPPSYEDTYTLTTSTTGTGGGTIGMSPSGTTFASGTVVTLTATPESGSFFTGWSGACSGTRTCVLTMDADKAATAMFTVDSPPDEALSLSITSGTCTEIPFDPLYGYLKVEIQGTASGSVSSVVMSGYLMLPSEECSSWTAGGSCVRGQTESSNTTWSFSRGGWSGAATWNVRVEDNTPGSTDYIYKTINITCPELTY